MSKFFNGRILTTGRLCQKHKSIFDSKNGILFAKSDKEEMDRIYGQQKSMKILLFI